MVITYKQAGVDIDASDEAEDRIKKHVKSTYNKFVLASHGMFGGLFELSKYYKNPVLVSSCDGVGTKLKLAYTTKNHTTVGQDLVNHCVNDILVQGATPLFFLDYIGTGKLNPPEVEQLVQGMAQACKENGCALIGGETAELPRMYKLGEYDLAGFIVGVAEKDALITGKEICPGDVVLGLPSSGMHTNGYSLAFRIIEEAGLDYNEVYPELKSSLADELMEVHSSYLKPMQKMLERYPKSIKGLAHITGGGFNENVPRILPPGCNAKIKKGSWPILPIFTFLQKRGAISEEEMYKVFNMGIGMAVVVKREDAKKIRSELKRCYEIGAIVKGKGEVVL